MEAELAPFNPWLEIWYSPRRTIRRIITLDPKRDIYLLALLIGYSTWLDRASTQGWGDGMPVWGILIAGLLVGFLGGIVSLGIGGLITGFLGRLLGGDASNEEVTAALAWSQVPSIFGLILWIPQLLLLGGETFMSSSSRLEATPFLSLLLVPFFLIHLALGIWQIVLTVLTVAEVHRFSVWRSIGTLILPTLVIGIPLGAFLVLSASH